MIGPSMQLNVCPILMRNAIRVATIDGEGIYLPIRNRCLTKARKLAKRYDTDIQELTLEELEGSAMMFRACGGESLLEADITEIVVTPPCSGSAGGCGWKVE